MSVSSTKNLGLRGSKGKIIEFDIKDEIYVGGTFTNTEGSNFQYVDGFLTVDENGTYDSEFSSNPYGFTSNVRASIYKVLQQPDGKILVGGNFSGYINPNLQTVGVPTSNLIRLNSDATVDSTFLSWMNPSFGSFQGEIFDMALQSDGKLIVVGNFITGGQISRNRIVRLNSNSTIDTSFVVGTGFGTSTNNPIRVVKILSDGKVLLGTNYTTYNGITVTRLLRLNSDASVDNTFNIGTGPTSTVTCIEFQSDGKMLVGGYFTSFNGVTTNRIVRLNSDGSRDTDFNIGTGFSGDVECIAIQNDGKILVGGNFSSYPLNNGGVFQLSDGSCVLLESYGVVSRNQPERLITFGPFLSCIECSTPDDSAGVESIICISCDDVYSVTATTVPHAIYLNNQGRAISQINTVAIGGFNGLNN